MSRPRLRFEDLTGGYGSTTIVRDLAGAAIAGEALCVLGRNGVGKTTLMKLLTGYLPCCAGAFSSTNSRSRRSTPRRAGAPASAIARKSGRCSTICRCATISR